MQEKRIKIEGQDTPYIIRDNGTIWSEKRNRELKGTVQRNEYQTVYLMFNGKQYNFMVHRLVAEYFCDNPHNYTIVHHINEDKLDNRAENLQWVTTQENILATQRKIKQTNKTIEVFQEDEWQQVCGFEKYLINREGQIVNKSTHKLLCFAERNGYLRVTLVQNNKSHTLSVHRLVYETFVGLIPEKMFIDHIDGNRANNKLENLRLVSHSENMKNSMANGHAGQVPVLQFDTQGNFIREFPTIQAAADEMGVKHPAIRSAICRNGTCGGYKWEKKKLNIKPDML